MYTATKDKAQKLEANTPALPAPAPLFKEIAAPTEKTTLNEPAEEKPAATEAAATTEEKPKAKRGRKPGSKNKSTLAKEAEEAEKNRLPKQTNRLRFLLKTTWNFHRSI